MDADVYGPNIPRMFGVFEKPPVVGGKIQPLEAHGVKLMSLGFLVERDAPAIWRGPIIMKIVQQFLRDVDWGELDYFIVDLPPGTGDAQLSLVQSTQVAGAVIVTTPQEVAVGDALRGAKMFERVGVPVIGRRGEHERVHRSRDRPALRAVLLGRRAAPGRRDRRPAAGQRSRSSPAWPSWPTPGQPVLIANPDSPAAESLRRIAADLRRKTVGQSPALPILRN